MVSSGLLKAVMWLGIPLASGYIVNGFKESREVFTWRDFCIGLYLIWTMANKRMMPTVRALPQARWQEYGQWLLGRRRRFLVRETSMVPTLMPGDTVLAEMGGQVQVGDIAIAHIPTAASTSTESTDLLLIKRVREIFYDGGVYVISDNTEAPGVCDSRHFGVIAAHRILGRVTSRLASAPK
ncbi:MAG: S24/S26 family peptidase [Cyanobacteria bacterium P01_B01_bin.77]